MLCGINVWALIVHRDHNISWREIDSRLQKRCWGWSWSWGWCWSWCWSTSWCYWRIADAKRDAAEWRCYKSKVYVCVCICAYIYVCIYIHIYMCVCTGREKDREYNIQTCRILLYVQFSCIQTQWRVPRDGPEPSCTQLCITKEESQNEVASSYPILCHFPFTWTSLQVKVLNACIAKQLKHSFNCIILYQWIIIY